MLPRCIDNIPDRSWLTRSLSFLLLLLLIRTRTFLLADVVSNQYKRKQEHKTSNDDSHYNCIRNGLIFHGCLAKMGRIHRHACLNHMVISGLRNKAVALALRVSLDGHMSGTPWDWTREFRPAETLRRKSILEFNDWTASMFTLLTTTVPEGGVAVFDGSGGVVNQVHLGLFSFRFKL